jgi:hypothetical protein
VSRLYIDPVRAAVHVVVMVSPVQSTSPIEIGCSTDGYYPEGNLDTQPGSMAFAVSVHEQGNPVDPEPIVISGSYYVYQCLCIRSGSTESRPCSLCFAFVLDSIGDGSPTPIDMRLFVVSPCEHPLIPDAFRLIQEHLTGVSCVSAADDSQVIDLTGSVRDSPDWGSRGVLVVVTNHCDFEKPGASHCCLCASYRNSYSSCRNQ